MNELALGRLGCLSVHLRCLLEKASVKPQGMLTNGQSLNHSYASLRMFGLFKRKPNQMTEAEYRVEYRRLLRELGEQFAVGDSPQEELLNAMGMVDHEMNGNGGCNWKEKDYFEYLDTLGEHLSAESRFTSEQLEKIQWSFDEILACARELDQQGESHATRRKRLTT